MTPRESGVTSRGGMGKKRARAQRIGVRGENEFRRFAERHRLIANKVEQDFGTDFLCQVEGRPDRRGTTAIIGTIIGAFVRATSNRRARVQIDRDDAQHLLECDYPLAIVLVHDVAPTPTCYARFVDKQLGTLLGEFLLGDTSSMTVTPALLASETSFDEHLRRALAPGFVEEVRLALATTRVQSSIPESRVRIQRTGNGSFTLVQMRDYLSQYDQHNKSFREQIYSAVFGHDRHFRRRLGQVPIREDLLAALEHRSVRFPGSFRVLPAGDRQKPYDCDPLALGGAAMRRRERPDDDRRTPLDPEPHDQQTRADAAETAGKTSAALRHAPAAPTRSVRRLLSRRARRDVPRHR